MVAIRIEVCIVEAMLIDDSRTVSGEQKRLHGPQTIRSAFPIDFLNLGRGLRDDPVLQILPTFARKGRMARPVDHCRCHVVAHALAIR